MGNLAEIFILGRWIPAVCHLEEIEQEPPTMCVWNATILVLIFIIMCPNLIAR
jgi:hypothetical protein